jgi:hypothetical protein
MAHQSIRLLEVARVDDDLLRGLVVGVCRVVELFAVLNEERVWTGRPNGAGCGYFPQNLDSQGYCPGKIGIDLTDARGLLSGTTAVGVAENLRTE